MGARSSAIGTQLTFSQDQSQPYNAQRPERLNWIRAIDLPLAIGSRTGAVVFTERDYGVRQAFDVSHLFTGF